MKKQLFAVLASLLLLLSPTSLLATAQSSVITIPLSLTIPESATLSISVSTLAISNANPSQAATLTLGWQIAGGHTTGPTLFSWFSVLPICNTTSSPACTNPTTFPAAQLSTQFAGGATTVCTGALFTGAVTGVAGQNCGTFTAPTPTGTIGTDLNDTTTVPFTLIGSFPVSTPLGQYNGGVLNLALVIN